MGFHRFLQASLFTIYYTAGGSSAALDVPWLVGEAWHLANRMGKLLRLMMICPDSDRHPDPRFSAGPAARRQARYAIIPQFSRFATDGSNRGPIPSQDRYNKLLSSKRNSFVPKWTHPIPIPMDNCPTCQTPNRELARFCRACGAWLLPRCPFCDAEILLPSAFCDQCGRVLNSEAPTPRSAETPEEASPLSLGAPIREEAASPASPLQSLIPAEMQARLKDARQDRAMEGQRRVVTMMFCDVQGSTAAANRFDPEEWAGIINGAFECMIPPVYHFEGTVARLMGDGILAFFGAPIAHEDDPQRAVLAGLEILEKFTRYKALVSSQWGVEIDARVGINTGLVVVGAVGSDLQVEYTAVGDAINIAARMEQTAAPGTLQISDVTHKRVASHFEFEDLGFIQVKGQPEPVHTFRPLRKKSRSERRRGAELPQTPLVGRADEFGRIQSAFDQLSQRGVGALMFLTGEAGIGKSRLIDEIRGEYGGGRVQFYQVSPLSFEASQPYAFFGSFLHQLTGILENDSMEAAGPKLAALSEELPVEVRAGVTDAFASLLGLADGDAAPSADGEAFKRQLFATSQAVVRARFAGSPGAIVLDDLQWADPASLEIFAHLFALVDTVPVLFLCATRPDREASVWGMKNALLEKYPHRFVEIPIPPLSSDGSRALVDELLDEAELPESLRKLILEKSEGNPLFLEETVRTLIEEYVLVQAEEAGAGGDDRRLVLSDVEEIDIPDSLQTLLAARLDRLQEETRQVLQMAAVIGRTFQYRVLQFITDSLIDLDDSLTTLQRAEMVVETSRLPELEYAFRHTLLQEAAYHSILRRERRLFHRQVGEVMEELFAARLDEVAPLLAMHFERAHDEVRAFRYLLHAGDTAFRLHAVTEAIMHYSKALDIIRGRVPGLAQLAPEPDTLRHLCLRLGRAYELGGGYDEALSHYSDIAEYARSTGDRQLELAVTAAHATIHSAPTDKFDRELAENLSQYALELAQELGDHETEAKIYWNLMNMSGFSGEPEQGFEYGLRSLEIARRYNLREQLAYTLNDYQRALMVKGQIDEARQMIEEAQALWLELGNQPMYTDSLSSAALLYLAQGDHARAERVCLEALQLSQEIGNLWGQCYSYYTLGYLYISLGEFEQALQAMEECLRLVEPSGFAVPLVDSNAYIGWAYAYLGDYERGKSYALSALQHARDRLPALQMGPAAVLAIVEYWYGNLEAMEEWLGDSDPVPGLLSFSGFERFVAECFRLSAKGEYEKLVKLSTENVKKFRPFGDMVFLSDILRLTGEALLALDRFDEARGYLEEAQDHARPAPHRQMDIFLALSRLEAKLGNNEAAQAHRAAARRSLELVLERIGDPGLEASFLARPSIKAILEE